MRAVMMAPPDNLAAMASTAAASISEAGPEQNTAGRHVGCRGIVLAGPRSPAGDHTRLYRGANNDRAVPTGNHEIEAKFLGG
jgi:hypothetical protein